MCEQLCVLVVFEYVINMSVRVCNCVRECIHLRESVSVYIGGERMLVKMEGDMESPAPLPL